jgi:hypothetical protein
MNIRREIFTSFFLNCILGSGVQLVSHGTAATYRPIVPAPCDYDDGEIGGMMFGRGNWSSRRKPAPVPLCPPQTPHAVPGFEPGHLTHGEHIFILELRISRRRLWRVLSSWVWYRIVWYRDKLLTEYMALYLRGQYTTNYFEFTAVIAIIQGPVWILYKPYVIITVFILKQILQTSYCLRTNMYWDLKRLHISINRPVIYM